MNETVINPEQQTLRSAGMFFIRVLLGVIFFMQGYGKIFTSGKPGTMAC